MIFSNVDQHERMLSCPIRIDTYHAAIHKYIKEGDTVVDLGTGTGVLSFFASQKKPKHIYAIDHGSIVDLAKVLAKDNNIHNITFVQAHSSTFTPNEKVDVILHEQIGDFLVDEDMVKNLCDLRDRILKPGGIILPNEFDLFMEPTQLLDGNRTSFLWEKDLHGIRFGASKKWLEGNENTIGRTINYHQLHAGKASHFLCEPEPVFSFDIMSADPNNMPTRFKASKRVVAPGMMDGFCLYFNIRFDKELYINTSPLAEPTVWLHQIFRTEQTPCEIGDIIDLELEMPDYSRVATWILKHTVRKGVLKPELHY